jgi:pilus assembly protein Flp/PilA
MGASINSISPLHRVAIEAMREPWRETTVSPILLRSCADKLRSSPEENRVPMQFCSKEKAIARYLEHRIQLTFNNRRHVRRMKIIRKFLADESGATAIEYGLIAAGIALAIISAVQGVGTKLSTNFGKVSTSLK